MQKALSLLKQKRVWIPLGIILGLGLVFYYVKNHTTEFAISSLNLFQKVSQLLPISPDTKKEITLVNDLVAKFTAKDGQTYTFLLFLQNNYELRPGGGFLGQYAVISIKDGQVISARFQDSNLLDQGNNAKVTPPYPITRKLGDKRWKFSNSNFSPDFPTNVDKGFYLYRLSGGGNTDQFDGVIAVNATVFDHVLGLTGPITPSGYNTTFTSDGGALKLEEVVEKAYIGDDVNPDSKQARKNIMKALTAAIIDKLATLNNIPKIADLGAEELRNKNVMLWFRDSNLESRVAEVHWDGSVSKDWDGDYVMFVDANLGAFKTDYYMTRKLDYTVDFTGDKPQATAVYTYHNNAPGADWRTTDYHTYVRLYTPLGSKYVDRYLINAVSQGTDEFNKTYFGGYVDAEIGQGDVTTTLKYELPDNIKLDGYRLLVQKQSGIPDLPVHIKLITPNGDIEQNTEIKHDTVFQFQADQEKKQ